jgi:hypothetical protein
MSKSKKNKIIPVMVATILFAGFFYAFKEDDEREDDEYRFPSVTQRAEAATAKPTVTKETNTKTTIIKDSDGDGLNDSTDPNPNISEIYIVEDENLNGIVDKFENGQ